MEDDWKKNYTDLMECSQCHKMVKALVEEDKKHPVCISCFIPPSLG